MVAWMAEFDGSMSDDELLALVEESTIDETTERIAKEMWTSSNQERTNSDETQKQHDETNFDSTIVQFRR